MSLNTVKRFAVRLLSTSLLLCATLMPAGMASAATEWTASLTVNKNTTGLNTSVYLSAATNHSLTFTPYYLAIYDITTGTKVKSCGTGTTCSTYVQQSTFTTRRYAAFVTRYPNTWPPTFTAFSKPQFVTWASGGRTLGLSVSETDYPYYGDAVIYAQTNMDVTGTGYSIQVFNVNTMQRVGICATGTSCAVNFPVGGQGGTWDFVAFIAPASTVMPPSYTQASSATINYNFTPIN